MGKRDDGNKDYYVYNVFYRGILVYVGKGTGKRWKHVAYGRSNSELINDFYFRNKYLNDMNLDIRIHKYFSTDLQAKEEEKKQINKHKPFCNKVAGREHSEKYTFKGKLEEVAKEEGYDVPEVLWSKFDFSFLFTPKGLLCKKVHLSKNSIFEYTGEEYHIRIKSQVFKYFPEYLLRFLNFDNESDAEYWNFFGVRNSYIQGLETGLYSLTEYGDLDWHIEAINSKFFKYTKNNDRQFDVGRFKESQTRKNNTR